MEQIVTRHRHELKRRNLTVTEVSRLTPNMIRVVLSGADMADFVSLGFDDHVKLVFEAEGETPVMREYTPRAFDTAAGTLTLEFAVHDAGPATAWAVAAKVGDTLAIGGPRGSAVIAPVFDWWLLIGDETALPAIARAVEEMPAGVRVMTLGAVPEEADRQEFTGAATVTSEWVMRPESAAADPAPVLEAARRIELPQEGRGFIWIAAEAKVARALRDHFRDERGHPAPQIKAAGYWTAGLADTSDKSLE